MAPHYATMPKPELTDRQFARISTRVGELCGINLHTGKQELVKARLNRHLARHGLGCFDAYMDLIESDPTGQEQTVMLDALSTNLTHFFREQDHFTYLAEHLLPRHARNQKHARRDLRIWSAGASTGEEPYSIALTVAQSPVGDDLGDVGILATDLSSRAITAAARGVYDAKRIAPVPPQWRATHFELVESRPERLYRVNDDLRRMMHFAKLNLMDAWPMQGKFDVIFCRNVMIYFDKPTQAKLINRFWNMLNPGGTLFIGHSESLAGVRHKFRYVQPTVYERV
jgi:chemotaxis protein methyltransferase CheR